MLAAVPARLAHKREQLAYWRAHGDGAARVARLEHEIAWLEAQMRSGKTLPKGDDWADLSADEQRKLVKAQMSESGGE